MTIEKDLAGLFTNVAELANEVVRLRERNAKLEVMLLHSMEMTTELLAMARSTTYIMVPK